MDKRAKLLRLFHPQKLPVGQEKDADPAAEKPDAERRFEKPAAYSELRLGDLAFYCREKTRRREACAEKPLRLDRAVTDSVSVCKDEKNENVLRIRVPVPTFDAGDREWDSYRELRIRSEAGRLHALLIAGGYKIASVYSCSDLRCADRQTEALLAELGFIRGER